MNDYIKREDVIETVYKLREHFKCWDRNDDITIKNALNAIPLADVRENVRGEWIETDILWTAMTEATSVQIPSKICSVCQKPVPQIMWNNFCPNCGADMRG